MIHHRVDLAFEADALIGEGPFWRPESGTLEWVDIQRGQLHRTQLETGTNLTLNVTAPLGSAVPLTDGTGWIGGARDGVVVFDEGGRLSNTIPIEPDLPTNRMNDAACDALGRFWTGTMAEDGQRHRAALYRVDHDGAVTCAKRGLSLPNGIGWSPDNEVMYVIDSVEQTLTAYAFNLPAGRIDATINVLDIDGTPDGLAVDTEGCIWVAMWGGGQVRRFTPTGTIDTVIDLPVPQVTSVAFCSTTLAITTACVGLTSAGLAAAPLSGSVFVAEVGVKGAPAFRFGEPNQ